MLAAKRITAGCLLAALLAGCIPSLHPIYSSSDLVDPSGLIGRWQSVDGKQHWEFTHLDDQSVRLNYVDDKHQTGTFKGHLTEIGGATFLDLQPLPAFSTDSASFYKMHWIKSHTFFRVKLDANRMSLAFLNPEWLKTYLRANPDALELESLSDASVVLTAETAELRQFVLDHLETKHAFTEPFVLEKAADR